MNYFLVKVPLAIITVFITAFLSYLIIQYTPGSELEIKSAKLSTSSSHSLNFSYSPSITDSKTPTTLITLKGFSNLLKSYFQLNFGYSKHFGSDNLTLLIPAVRLTLTFAVLYLVLSFTFELFLAFSLLFLAETIFYKPLCAILYLLYTIPFFIIGTVLVILFCGDMWQFSLPIGWPTHLFFSWKHALLPLSCYILSYISFFGLSLEANLEEEAKNEYVLTAKAKGLSDIKILFTHILRNTVPNFIGNFNIKINSFLFSCLGVETLFNIPGIGRLIKDSLYYRDYSLVLVLFILISITHTLSALLRDLLLKTFHKRVVL